MPAADEIVRASGQNQAATLWVRDRIAKFLRRVDPQTNGIQCVGECVPLRCAMGGAARKFRHLGDEPKLSSRWHRSSKRMAASAVPLSTRRRILSAATMTFSRITLAYFIPN